MLKYCFILDEETGLVQIGVGCKDSYYQEIGMKERDVEISEIDEEWYLADKCPHYTEEERLALAKESKYKEANRLAETFLSGEATFELDEDFHVEATKENMSSFTSAALAIEKGFIPYQEWTSQEDNVRQLDGEQCFTICMGIGAIQTSVWTIQFIAYRDAIDAATTVAEVEAIKIVYTTNLEESQEA